MSIPVGFAKCGRFGLLLKFKIKDTGHLNQLFICSTTKRLPGARTFCEAASSKSGENASDNLKAEVHFTERNELLDRIIRVDHAGELGADRIYAGQYAVLKNTSVGPLIKHMWDQEKHHLETFSQLIPKHRVRPTVLLPLWNIAGFALGAGSALLGKEGAMACTVAVETVIGDHYNDQLRELLADDPTKHAELIKTITKFRDEEMEHHDAGLDNDAEQAPLYGCLTETIKFGCKVAIWISERA